MSRKRSLEVQDKSAGGSPLGCSDAPLGRDDIEAVRAGGEVAALHRCAPPARVPPRAEAALPPVLSPHALTAEDGKNFGFQGKLPVLDHTIPL